MIQESPKISLVSPLISPVVCSKHNADMTQATNISPTRGITAIWNHLNDLDDSECKKKALLSEIDSLITRLIYEK